MVADTWLAVAAEVAKRSRCVRSQVGCVLVDAGGRVISTGYNGPPAGYTLADNRTSCAAFCPRHDTDHGRPDFSDCPSVHAELNALLYSERARREGGTAYITRDPCFDCAKALANSGIKEVRWNWVGSERETRVALFLRQCGLKVQSTSLSFFDHPKLEGIAW